jgi:crossover junction endodeoxyribonuclease RusA
MGMALIVLDLPWPNRVLSPNARSHWAEKARATKEHRAWARWGTEYRIFDPLVREVHVTITAYPPSLRTFDDDNFISRCKPYLDGIADSLCINDSKFRVQPLRRGQKMKHGNVKFQIEVV